MSTDEHSCTFPQAMERFMQTVYQAIIRHLPFATLKVVVLASPGFTKDAVRCLSPSLDFVNNPEPASLA